MVDHLRFALLTHLLPHLNFRLVEIIVGYERAPDIIVPAIGVGTGKAGVHPYNPNFRLN